MFVMVISLLVFSFLGWPKLATRVISRLLLIPVIAGLSYEVLQWTGRHSNACVKILSMPGILLQIHILPVMGIEGTGCSSHDPILI